VEKGEYDVFLCHNSVDKEKVLEIGRRLKDRNILPWVDEWDVRPGSSWLNEIMSRIESIKSAAIFVGKGNLGPWQEREVAAIIQRFVKTGLPVIPVILRDCTEKPKLPAFLSDLRWVDWRSEVADPLAELIWGITGKRPMDPHS
jgi:hypothetical protein